MLDPKFVNVNRVEHGDTMVIPRVVQEKYPSIYVIIEEEEIVVPKEVVAVEVVPEIVKVPEVVEVVPEVEKKPRTRRGK